MIDCSTIYIMTKKMYRKWFLPRWKFWKYIELCGFYQHSKDCIFLYSKNNKWAINQVPELISHETLHKILTHYISNEASSGLDKYLKANKKYNTRDLHGGI